MRAALLLLSAAACSPAPIELSFSVPADTRSVIFGHAQAGALSFTAADLAEGAPIEQPILSAYEGEAELWVLTYPRPLAAYELEPGPLAPPQGDQLDRGLPPFARAYARRLVGEVAEPWSEVPEPSAALRAFRTIYRPPWACVEAGGCFDPTTAAGCLVPCPAGPTGDAPAANQRGQVVTDPRFTCPPGWIPRAGLPGLPAGCAPAAAPASCPPGQWSVPSGAGCAVLGTPCPPGQWAPDLPAGTLHVDAQAPAGGDGSVQAPFRRLEDALAAIAPGGLVALAPGDHPTPASFSGRARLRGACTASTHLVPPGALVVGGELALQDLELRGRLQVAGSVQLDGVALRAAGGPALALGPGGAVSGRRVSLRSDQRAIEVQEGATLALDGLELTAAATLLASGTGARVQLADAFLLHPIAAQEPKLLLSAGARLELERSHLRSGDGRGLFAHAAEILLRDSSLEGMPAEVSGPLGAGVVLAGGTTATISGVLVAGSIDVGVGVNDAGTRALLQDLLIEGVAARTGDLASGHGLLVASDAEVHAERVWVGGVQGQGVTLVDARLTAQDLVIHEPGPAEGLVQSGYGLVAGGRSRLEVEGLHIRGASVVALRLSGGEVSGRVRRASIVKTLVNAATGAQGRGVEVDLGGTLELERVRIAGGDGAGIFAHGDGTRISGVDLFVGESSHPSCGNVLCGGPDIQAGVRATAGAQIDLRRFSLHRNGHCGAYADQGGALSLADGAVTDHPLGAYLRSSLATTRAVAERVLYQGNAHPVDSDERPPEL